MAVVFLSTFMFPHRFVFVVMSSVFLCLPAKLVSLVSFLFVFWVNNRLCSCFDHFAKHVMLVEEASAFCLLKLASYPCCSTVFGAAHLLKDFHTTLLIRPLLLRTGGVASLVPSIMALEYLFHGLAISKAAYEWCPPLQARRRCKRDLIWQDALLLPSVYLQ